ncbi:hypothetical protein [Variovorax sp. EL159]|uniref:hypothetical protein n=1 Tax=Variovorax sp. EL159 TaxID=1566270 RepID=UPI000890A166|nr:hypothetical protein [Variovorax sp. EL159]SCX73142.1 hypothetical protein SAMN03159363_4868 [Variovorax sp. EL159]
MQILLPVLFMVVLVGAVFFGSCLLRTILLREHALQSRLSDEAIAGYVSFAMKNAKGIMAILLMIYFMVAGAFYS